jgi:hypothetical protein
MKKGFFFSAAAMAVLVFLSGLALSGCGTSCTGETALPAAWASVGFAPVEGGSVCTYDDKHAKISHTGIGIPDLADKYTQKLKSAGWNVSDLNRKSLSIDADKGDSRFSVQFTECTKTIGTCTDAIIDRSK